MSLIEIKDLGISFDDLKVVDNFNLEMDHGEFVCILGPSGCGKSTILKTIAGYLNNYSGDVLMNGEKIEKPSKDRGVVFQAPTLYPWLSVYDNVAFGPKSLGKNKEEIDKIVTTFLDEVNLEGFEDTKTFELSGGMKQRVSLARTLANYPQVILMDEPFGALDALTRVTMQELIRKIWKKHNSTIFLITHDVDEALALATKIIVMGKRPTTIIKEYQVDFTNQIFNSASRHLHFGDEYNSIKDDILDLINLQNED